jgi:hypothetical protein
MSTIAVEVQPSFGWLIVVMIVIVMICHLFDLDIISTTLLLFIPLILVTWLHLRSTKSSHHHIIITRQSRLWPYLTTLSHTSNSSADGINNIGHGASGAKVCLRSSQFPMIIF